MAGDSPSFTAQQLRDGMRLLRELLPRARVKAAETGEIKEMSALARAARPYLKEENLKALLVYQTPLGGWIADVLLNHVPPGVSNIMGTPTRYPLKTREEAVAQGTDVMAFIIASNTIPSKNTTEMADAGPVFFYFDAIFPLVPDLLVILQNHGASYSSLEHAHARLKAITVELFGRQKPSYKLVVARSEDDQKRLASVFHIAALTGVMRYPPIELGMPGDKYDDDAKFDKTADV